MTIFTKKVSDFISIVYIGCATKVLQLDGINVKNIGVVKHYPMKLHKYPGVSVIQDITMVDLPLMFSLCLYREFNSKLDGYLAMDYSQMTIPFKNKNFKMMNEVASSFHTEKVAQANVFYEDAKMINSIQEKIDTVDQVANDVLYQVEDIGHRNYCIYEYSSKLSMLSKNDLRNTEI